MKLPNHNLVCEYHQDGDTMIKKRICDVTGEEYAVTMDLGAFIRYRAGEFAQNAFPDMPAEERKFIISGITPAMWDNLFKMEE